MKIGETIYKCRTCISQYQAAQELCESCNNRGSQEHAGHDIGRLVIRRATDMPDDFDIQCQNCWRCAFPGCGHGMYRKPLCYSALDTYSISLRTTLTSIVTGPQLDWRHRHPEAVLSIGDALADRCRWIAPSECAKTELVRLRLKDPPNATDTLKCGICIKGSLISNPNQQLYQRVLITFNGLASNCVRALASLVPNLHLVHLQNLYRHRSRGTPSSHALDTSR